MLEPLDSHITQTGFEKCVHSENLSSDDNKINGAYQRPPGRGAAGEAGGGGPMGEEGDWGGGLAAGKMCHWKKTDTALSYDYLPTEGHFPKKNRPVTFDVQSVTPLPGDFDFPF